MSGASPGSPAALRHINQAHVLAVVRRSEALRLGEIAETTGLSRPTVASALDVPLEEAMEGVGVSCGVPLDRLD